MLGEIAQTKLPLYSLGLVAKSVKQLRYGANDESGFYMEGLEIETDNGEKKYVMHLYSRHGGHLKAEYDTPERINKAFDGLCVPRDVSWDHTDELCGYKMDPEMLQRAHKEGTRIRMGLY